MATEEATAKATATATATAIWAQARSRVVLTAAAAALVEASQGEEKKEIWAMALGHQWDLDRAFTL